MERRDTVINDKMYSILLPTPRQVMPLCTKMAVLFGAVLPTLTKATDEGGLDKFAEAIQKVDPMAIDAAFMEAVSISHLCCNNEPISTVINFDKHFSDFRNETYQVCAWTLWECVKDFFPQLDSFSQKATSALAGAFKSPTVGQ